MPMTFKEAAYAVLKNAGKPLHASEITKKALQSGLLTTAGKTPVATMLAQLIVDVNKKRQRSIFVKTGASTFGINPNRSLELEAVKKEVEEEEKTYDVTSSISPKQKGDIAEARIAELITLYGQGALACYRPISDDEGIDLIVKEKRTNKSVYIQVKSRFGTKKKNVYVARVKKPSVVEGANLFIVFCFFDVDDGNLWDYLWFVPAEALVKGATIVNSERLGPAYSFVAGRAGDGTNGRKWDTYLIDKRDLAYEVSKMLQLNK